MNTVHQALEVQEAMAATVAFARHYLRTRRFRHYTAGGFSPTRLAAIYGFPAGATGKGQRIAVIELGGGFVQSDLDAYFHSLGLTVAPVVFHGIQGATNTPDGPDGADGEVMLDLCVAGGMAPGAELHCYTAPNTDVGFLNAVRQARLDGMTAISISWGAPEDAWSAGSLQAFDAELSECRMAGITVTAAAGDSGSGDDEPGSHVDFPSSSPHVLACGGTSLTSVSPLVEVVWNDGTAGGSTGGGVSALFPRPSYQSGVNVPGGRMRGVPDVAGNADPSTGWDIVVDGAEMVIGGTSAVAPMWAALAACLSEALGAPVGFLNPKLYAAAGWSRDIVSGNNGTYSARSGWDACTGLGVPVGTRLLAALRAPAPVPAPPPQPPAPPAPVSTPTTVRNIVVSGHGMTLSVDGKAVP